jgi:hypothetical protein
MSQEAFIFSHFLQATLANSAQYQHWIVATGFPQLSVKTTEQIACREMPIPVEVVGQLAQGFKIGG